MDLIPSERAVLRMIGMLFLEASTRTHPVTFLRSRWPTLHVEAYSGGFAGLMRKGLISLSADQQVFSVTSNGLRAMTAFRRAPLTPSSCKKMKAERMCDATNGGV